MVRKVIGHHRTKLECNVSEDTENKQQCTMRRGGELRTSDPVRPIGFVYVVVSMQKPVEGAAASQRARGWVNQSGRGRGGVAPWYIAQMGLCAAVGAGRSTASARRPAAAGSGGSRRLL